MSPGTGCSGFSRNSAHAAVGIRRHQPERARVFDVVQRDRRLAPRSRWSASIAVRSRSVRMSPFSAKNGSSPSSVSAFTIAPPVPSGAVSVIHVIAGSPLPRRDERLEHRLQVRRRQHHLVDAVACQVIERRGRATAGPSTGPVASGWSPSADAAACPRRRPARPPSPDEPPPQPRELGPRTERGPRERQRQSPPSGCAVLAVVPVDAPRSASRTCVGTGRSTRRSRGGSRPPV